MSTMTRQRNRRDKPTDIHKWKVIDHRSGFELLSDQVIMDTKGVLTHKKDVDPHYPIEADQKLNHVPRPLPFVRNEHATYTNNNPYAARGLLYWEGWDTVTWDNWFTKWNEA